MRKLTKTLAAVSLMTPMYAHPLGIGDIQLHSALNERLSAEIKLNLGEDESLGDLRIKLASPEKFAEVGIPRNYFLTEIKFKPILKPDGSVIIELSSDVTLKEPFLDFLLEVSWPKGSLYREFSVLIDPPVTFRQPVAPVVQTATSARTYNTRPAQAYQEPRNAQKNQGIESYTVRKNDTLWEIANDLKPANASVEQMMIALFQENPDAFIKQNINNVILGKRLQVPDEQTVLRISKSSAKAEFQRQTNIWKGNIAPPPAQEIVAAEESSRLKITAPSDVDVNAGETVTSKIIEQGAVAELSKQAQPIVRDVDPQVNERLNKLEEQLNRMQKLLALRDEQIAALQQEKTKLAEQETVKPPKVETPKIEEVPPPPMITEEQLRPIPAEDKPEKPTTVQPVQPIKPQPAPVKVKPVIETAAKEDNSVFYAILGGVSISILGLAGWLIWRKKLYAEDDSTESMFAASSEIILPEEDQELSIPVVEDNSSYDIGTVGESSFLSEFVPSDFDAFDTEQAEVDPISEADVYLAYGRYQQAEELMRHAIEDFPDRDECKLKLLEIFYANEDKKGYLQYASELAENGKKEEVVFWAKVSEMGSELLPDEELFQTSSAEDALSTESEQEPIAIESIDVDTAISEEETATDLEMVEFETPEQATKESEETETTQTLFEDSDVESLNSDEGELTFQELPVEEDQQDQDQALDFDFNFSDETPAENELENKPENQEFDFDFDQLTTGDDATESEDTQPDEVLYDLTTMDEMDTKIDLAKAYIDMGDPEAAKTIISEVLKKGTAEQKTVAQSIIDEML